MSNKQLEIIESEMMDGPGELGIPKVTWITLMALAEQHQRLQSEIGKLEQCIQA